MALPTERITHGRKREHDAEADVLTYDQDEFGFPRNVQLNGRKLHAVTGIEVTSLYTTEDYNEVTIKLKGTYVTINATPRESSAEDSGS